MLLLSFGALAAVLTAMVNAASSSPSVETTHDVIPIPGAHSTLQIPSPAKVTNVTHKSLSSRSSNLNKRLDEEAFFGILSQNAAILTAGCGLIFEGLAGPEACLAVALNGALTDIFSVGFLPAGTIEQSFTQDLGATNWIVTLYWEDPNVLAWETFNTADILSFAIDAAEVYVENEIQIGCLNAIDSEGVAWVGVVVVGFTGLEETLAAATIVEFIDDCSTLV